jgi:hypothetical protein
MARDGCWTAKLHLVETRSLFMLNLAGHPDIHLILVIQDNALDPGLRRDDSSY